MKLFEHPDFEQAILRATEHFQNRRLRAAIVEKDYYVTEALRLIAITAPDKIIFKGGTSLAKGWNLIQRFSEDIDIFLDPLAFKPRLGKNAIDRELKKLRDTVGAHAALTFVADESKTIERWAREGRIPAYHYFPALEVLRFRAGSLDALSCKFALPSVPLKTGGIGWNISGNGFSLVGLI